MLKKITGFVRKLSGRLPQRLKRKRAAFGIDAAIMIGFILAMMLTLAVAGPDIIKWFADALMGGSKGAYSLLLELPVWDPSKSPQKPPGGATPGQWVGYAAHLMQELMQNMALALLSVVLIIAAMCYIFETFRFMSEGTAMNIILNSVFTLIIIFAVPYIYNGVAAAINYVVGWPDVGGWGQIISSGSEIDALIGATGGGVLTGGWDLIVRFFGSVVIFIIAVSILMLAVMMGAVRLLLIGALAAALPLLLMLRLIPPVKHLADSLIETVVGIMFASVIAALLIHFGFMLVASTGLSGITKMAIALATLAGATYMSTMFAGRLGGLFMTMGGMASTASSMATGLMLGGAAMGAGTAAGGVAGVAQAAKQGLIGGGKLGTLKTGGAALFRGAGAGLATTAAQVLPGAITGRGPGRVMQYATGAMPRAVQSAQDLINKRAGTTAENLLYQFGAERAPGESAHMGLEWYHDMIEGKSDRQVGEYFANKMGLHFDAEKGGREIKKTLDSLKDNPALLDRIRINLEDFSSLPKDKRFAMIKNASDNWSVNKAKMEAALGRPFYDPELEALDKAPGFFERILNHNVLGMPGKVSKAWTYDLMRRGFEERLKKGELDYKRGVGFYEQVVGSGKNRKSDAEVYRWVESSLGVKAPKHLQERLGDSYKEFLDKVARKDPLLLDNFRRNLEEAGELGKKDPSEALNCLGENTRWLEEKVEFAVAPHGDYWRPARPPPSTLTPYKPKEKVKSKGDVFQVDAERFSAFWSGVDSSSAPAKPIAPERVQSPVSEQAPTQPSTLQSPKKLQRSSREISLLDLQRQNEMYHETLRKFHESEKRAGEKRKPEA